MLARRARAASRSRKRPASVLVLAALLASSIAALGASPEDAYLVARERYIALLKKNANAKDQTALVPQYDRAVKDLQEKLKPIIGPFAASGFPAAGKLNPDDGLGNEPGYDVLDGLLYGDHANSVLVTTDSLLDKWLVAHRDWTSKGDLPTDAAAAVKTENFYTQSVSTDAAVMHLAEIPVVVPAGAKFAYATVSARSQDGLPNAPDEIFVALEQAGRVFVVDERLATPIPPIATCDAAMADGQKKVDDSIQAYADAPHKSSKLAEKADKLTERLGNERDAAFRACFRTRVKDTPGFKAATDQAARIIAALKG
jgi:hypothetical protein